MTSIGKPYEGKLHVRFDEEGLVSPALHSTLIIEEKIKYDSHHKGLMQYNHNMGTID
jgi:hypothetical protein